MEDGLSWYSTVDKQSNIVCNIPLQYVCFTSTRALTPKFKFLTISKSSLSFECYNNANVRTNSIIYRINFKQILKFSYASENCLFNITMREDIYERMVANIGQEEELFRHRIWFCLDVNTIEEYRKFLDELSNNFAWKPSLMSDSSYNSFVDCLTRNNVSARFVAKWNVGEVLSSVEIAKSPAQLLSTPKAEFSIEGSSSSPVTSARRNRKRTNACLTPQESVYEPSLSYGVDICADDLVCLRSVCKVNDNIINFYITYILHEIITPVQQQRIHLFNCFFNTKLTGTKTQAPIDTPESRHARVAKWTKNVDIFEKDFLIIPVNECNRWFLVIVCFPWMAGMVSYDRLFHDAANASMPANDTEFAKRHRVDQLQVLMATEGPEYLPLPCILVFDSMSVAKRIDKIMIIRDYLMTEWDAKRTLRDGPLVFDKNTIRGYCPKVPQQDNDSDGGIYLLHYVESFFKHPITNFSYTFFKTYLAKWFDPSQIERKREEIRDTIMKVIRKSDDTVNEQISV